MSDQQNSNGDFMDVETNPASQQDTAPTQSAAIAGGAQGGENASDSRREKIWIAITITSFLFALLGSSVLNPLVAIQQQRVDQAEEVRNAVTLTGTAASEALSTEGRFKPVQTNRDAVRARVAELTSSNSMMEAMSTGLLGDSQANKALATSWSAYDDATNRFLQTEGEVTELKTKLNTLTVSVNKAIAESVEFVDAVAKEGRNKGSGPAKDKYLFLTSEAGTLSGKLGQLGASVRGFFIPNTDLAQLSDMQAGSMVRLQDTLNRIVSNAAAVVGTIAEPLQNSYRELDSQVQEIGAGSIAITDARAALGDMSSRGEALSDSLDAATKPSSLVQMLDKFGPLLPVVFGILGVYGLYRYFTLQSRDLVMHEASLSETLAEQQESILKLLDEMSALADGDLTVEAEVTDQITGAIADSVNFAVIEMRELVAQINRASIEVANESELAVNNAQAVSQSNKNQATQINSASKLMQQVSESMHSMSEQAANSSDMARESLQAAEQGTQAVRDTIKGMEDMREQIQDTSKRIKRLGESSQRIGDIVALIDDIAEQTNILSLNAAIQASMAGEAGRGFAVVSDEVQSLAERSTEATRKIAELVATIQTDTNDAVLSMEKATQHVVSGTQVADSAGSALAAIEDVSNRLTALVQGISEGSTKQAELVTQVSEQVSEVSNSSTETSRKAQASANSIAKLLELAKDLETSVSRFKLPAA
ncbi:MAG: hypothetical protein KJP04_08925 [Arenicella sp.]|nr:hypothetical protein [Arenicella sp.]